jgi:hypothetical protein
MESRVATPTAFDSLAACHPRLREAAAKVIGYWHPGAVPVTIALAEIGGALVGAEPDVDDETLGQVAAQVEVLLAERSAVADAVATGLLEAICHRSEESPSSVERIVGHRGVRALAYIRAWDEFTGVETPGAKRPAG